MYCDYTDYISCSCTFIPQTSRQLRYEARIRHLVEEIRRRDSEIERLSAASSAVHR